MKTLVLPRNIDPKCSVASPTSRRVIVIGANGAGKTRFAREMARLSGPDTIQISALSALYSVAAADREKGDFYDRAFLDSAIAPGEKTRPQTQLERLLGMLMNDELLALLSDKLRNLDKAASSGDSVTPAGRKSGGAKRTARSKLDDVITLFHSLFPNSSVLVESGRFLFRRHGENDRYEAVRLSDGERSVLYYAAAVLYAPQGVNIVVESPEIFLHPTTIQSLWNRLERLRPDCRFVYVTHDLDFAASRGGAAIIWVRGWEPSAGAFDYAMLAPDSELGENIYMAIMGDRRDVLFVEGDSRHSLDSKLYPLLFADRAVKAVGSCNRVIEATRTFNSLSDFHHMRATGIVDRDRRNQGEVDYLRRRNVLVPEVAEVENIFMLEDVIRTVAEDCGRDADKVFSRVRRGVISAFTSELRQQALEHTRHGMKKTVEYRVDGRFDNIGQLEQHIARLCIELNPRGVYEDFCREFRKMADSGRYADILRVYNHKSMIAAANVPALCGLQSKDAYISRVLQILSRPTPQAERIRRAVLACLRVDD